MPARQASAEPTPKPRPDSPLEMLVTALVFQANQKRQPLSHTRLMKLVYLVELYHRDLYGHPLTDVQFVKGPYGPFSADVGQAEESLQAKGVLRLEPTVTGKGRRATVPKPAISKAELDLPQSAWIVLELVGNEWANKATDEMADFTKRTIPYESAPGLGWGLDLRRVDVIAAMAQAEGISDSEAATRLVESSEEIINALKRPPRGKFFNWKETFA
jgi:hypothetical protein